MSEQIEQQNNKVQPTTEETTVATEQVAGFQVVNEGFSTREAMREDWWPRECCSGWRRQNINAKHFGKAITFRYCPTHN